MKIGRKPVPQTKYEMKTAAKSERLRLQFASFTEYTDARYGFVSDRMQPFVGCCSDTVALDELSGLYRRFEDALYSRDGKNEDGVHYSFYVSMDSLLSFYAMFRNTDIADLMFYRFYIHTDECGKLHFTFENADSTVNTPWDTAGICAGIECLLERAYKHDDFRTYAVAADTYTHRIFY